MSIRVTYEEVADIMGGSVLTSAQLDAMIEAASAFVDELAVLCPAISDAMLTQIEKFLAAHIASTADPQLVSSTRGDISETYKRSGNGQVTEFLTAALAMDPCGIVAERWAGKVRAKFMIGTTYTQDARRGTW